MQMHCFCNALAMQSYARLFLHNSLFLIPP
nr:MAG TPA: hypothetical protein [Caudoviricetes sp.]